MIHNGYFFILFPEGNCLSYPFPGTKSKNQIPGVKIKDIIQRGRFALSANLRTAKFFS